MSEVPRERYETNFVRLGYDANERVWVLAGADTDGGVWGLVAIKDAQNSWAQHRLSVRLKDAVFVSATEILACGSIVTEDRQTSWDTRRDGVVLYSVDGGAEWKIVYRNSAIKQINALSVLDATHVWAVGDRGSILRLDSLGTLSSKAIGRNKPGSGLQFCNSIEPYG
jgi:hypothetical protein